MKRQAFVVAAAFTAALATPALAMAQTGQAPGRSTNQQSSNDQQSQRVEQHIRSLHAALQIRPDQEQEWHQFARTIWQNSQDMQNVVQHREADLRSMNAEQDMESYAHLTEVHAQNMERLSAAFRTLYDSMSPQQQRNASQYFYQQAERFASEHQHKGG